MLHCRGIVCSVGGLFTDKGVALALALEVEACGEGV